MPRLSSTFQANRVTRLARAGPPVDNTEEAQRRAARAAFFGERTGAADAASCSNRECLGELVRVPAVHGAIPKPSCNPGDTCPRGQVRCSAEGSVRCTCTCERGT